MVGVAAIGDSDDVCRSSLSAVHCWRLGVERGRCQDLLVEQIASVISFKHRNLGRHLLRRT